jgi:enoyl-CoA hydratase/carnithine racemase
MLFTGDFIDAEQAAQWGLVNRCVDDNALDDKTQTMADTLAAKSFQALASGKALLRGLHELTLVDAYAKASENMACDTQSVDARMGISAFLDKQPMPKWSNQ